VQAHGGGVVRADHDQVELPDLRRHVRDGHLAGLGHRARVERRELRHLDIGGAHEAGGVRGLGDPDGAGVHTGGLEPAAVALVEIGAHGAHEHGLVAEAAHAEADVGPDAAALDHQLVDQEAQRQVREVLGEQLLGELPLEAHQMIGGDRPRNSYRHSRTLP
jgi:hypothetical protein